MGYIYENSDPERFQHLCQSLLLADYPSLQCFPVGQPDGGRDGWDLDSDTALQVKFKRTDEPDSADWMIAALEGELPKIRRMIEKGLSKYVMATNARGTGHEDSGKIDKVRAWLKKNISVPAVCLWRDDLDRRIDVAPVALKFKYSEIVMLSDGIELLFYQQFELQDKKKLDIIKWFLRDQFKKDKAVKFKQVHLSNELLDLFIDIPVSVGRGKRRREMRRDLDNFIVDVETDSKLAEIGIRSATADGIFIRRPSAAALILQVGSQVSGRHLLIEGAPGQGKSTLAQYVCQVHRAKFLRDEEMLNRIPEEHQRSAFKLPIKVDLRDFASFLEGNSPFQIMASAGVTSNPRSLEAFLAELISYGAGGVRLEVYDVLSILTETPVLLFLDGLDEVADLSVRDKLVESVSDTLNRLDGSGADVQVIMTSRPSIFGRSAALESSSFVTLVLENIDKPIIDEYTTKWVNARQLDRSEQREVRKILGEKLEHSHIQELTRNPMQLTILLSLVHQIGHSLPDQRTDLYHRYIDLFLTREADKSAAVRDNRTILVNFIASLAWHLQSQAESSRGAGSVSLEQLVDLAGAYLSAGSHDETLANTLFGGGLERVFVLVARIEGLYEFEVQPIREYFCALHLYETAPIGSRRCATPAGDRSQRFEAIAANPFWLNVTRFYAGFYAMGEVGNLVMSLKEMIADQDVARSIHARKVSILLLQDRVFADKKFHQTDLINTVFDEIGLGSVFAELAAARGERFSLQEECGADVLREILFRFFCNAVGGPHADVCALWLIYLDGEALTRKFIDSIEKTSGDIRTDWIAGLFGAGAGQSLSGIEIWRLLSDDSPDRGNLARRISSVFSSGISMYDVPDILVQEAVRSILDGLAPFTFIRPSSQSGALALLYSAFAISHWHPGAARLEFVDMVRYHLKNADESESSIPPVGADGLARIEEFGDAIIDAEQSVRGRAGNKSLGLLMLAAEKVTEVYGPNWAAMSMAIQLAGRSEIPKFAAHADQLNNGEVSVCVRARMARLKRGGAGWWVDQLSACTSRLDQMFWAGLVISWASPSNLTHLSDDLNRIIPSLSAEEFRALRWTIIACSALNDMRADRKKVIPFALDNFSDRAAILVSLAFGGRVSGSLLRKKSHEDPVVNEWISWTRLNAAVEHVPDWNDHVAVEKWMPLVMKYEMHDYPHSIFAMDVAYRAGRSVLFGERIVQRPLAYTLPFLKVGQSIVLDKYRPSSLTKIAKLEHWSFE
ncbi:hypothetical protein AB0M13_09755 [Nocardia fluminea]|uniref:NACHT domain-containing protein n=1 Tax=Nocardia fluminea TaxID=134984 RepID=UPI00343E4329